MAESGHRWEIAGTGGKAWLLRTKRGITKEQIGRLLAISKWQRWPSRASDYTKMAENSSIGQAFKKRLHRLLRGVRWKSAGGYRGGDMTFKMSHWEQNVTSRRISEKDEFYRQKKSPPDFWYFSKNRLNVTLISFPFFAGWHSICRKQCYSQSSEFYHRLGGG